MLNWRPLRPFGARIEADLSRALDDADRRLLRDLLWEHGVLVFKGQQLTHEDQARIVDIFEPVARNWEGMHFVSTDADDKGGLGRGELTFHADCAFLAEPRLVLSLHALDVVDGETSTRWVSARECRKAMPAGMRARLEDARALQVMPSEYSDRRSAKDIPSWLPQHWHDALIAHPRTGERLPFIMEMQTVRIEGLAHADGERLIDDVLGCFYRPEAQLEHFWDKGDFVIWDNVATQHARGSLAGTGRRVLQKVQAGGVPLEAHPAFASPQVQELLWATSKAERL